MSLSGYDKIQSINWNGHYFLLTARNELTDGSFSYAFSADGQKWKSIKFLNDLSGSNAFTTKWLGDKYLISGNITSSGSTSSRTSFVNVIEEEYPVAIPTDLSTDTIVYDVDKNIELPNRIVFPRTTILALGSQMKVCLDQGNTWLTCSSTLSFCSDAVWNGHIWVAVGQGTDGTIVTSLDGVNWINRGKYLFSDSCNGIDWSPQQNMFVATGSHGEVGISYDGIYWKKVKTGLFTVSYDVKWNGAIWVAVGEDGPSGATLAYSEDGFTWNYSVDTFSVKGIRVYWNVNTELWTVYGEDISNNIATSKDGISWVFSNISGASALSLGNTFPLLPDPSMNYYVDIPFPLKYPEFESTKYVHNHSERGTVIMQPISVACGEGDSTLAFSFDGIRWSSSVNALFTKCNKAVWNGTYWLSVGTGAFTVAKSYDGQTWEAIDTNIFTEALDIAWNGNLWVVVGEEGIAVSSDGTNWYLVINTGAYHYIEWTGQVWLSYGTSGTLVSDDGFTWTNKITCLTNCPNLSSSGSTFSASSTLDTNIANNVNDLTFNTIWSSGSFYSSGTYIGTETTIYDTSSSQALTVSGEWLQIQLSEPAVCHYYVFAGLNLQSFLLLGSTDSSSWVLLDSVETTLRNILPLEIENNTSEYMYYRVVFKETANTSEVNVGEVALYGASSGILNRFVKPVLLKDCVLHPWRIFEMEDTSFNVFRVTDLSCNWIRDGLHNGYTCDPVFPGSETSGTAFNGKYHVTFMKTGEAVYLSNTESLQGLQYDSVLNGLTLATGLTDIRTACFNRKFVLIGGAGGAAYGILSSNSPPEFHNSNLSSLMSTVNCIASNSGYGHVVCKNTIELKENERLSVTTPKYSVSQTSISFNVYKQE